MRDAASIAGALAEVRAWQRAFEWELARDLHGRTGAIAIVRRHTHDLFDHLQIVELASLELARRVQDQQELVGDIESAATALKVIVQQLVAGAMTGVRPTPPTGPIVVVEAPCRAAVARVTPAVGAAIALELQAPGARVACSADDLEHLIAGVLLEAHAARHIALLVRARAIDGAPWLELVRTTAAGGATDPHELRVLEALVTRSGGELARSEARGGGEELVVALPCAGG